jgi:hypothetical protein
MTKQDLWKANLEFYQELVTKHKWQQEPMIELIHYFDKVGICEKYFPSNSHESLGLSTADNYKQRLVLPMVYITYQAKTNTFKLTFQKGQGTTLNEEDCGVTLNDFAISKIEQWLSDTN